MPLKVTFDLSDKDLRYFRKLMRDARGKARAADESSICKAAQQLLEHVKTSDAPKCVKELLLKMRPMIEMLGDEEWRLEGEDRERVLSALTYFNEPKDVIPDHTPGFGFLDDAIMVQLVVEELRHEIEAFEKFCEYRATRSPDAAALAKQRVQLQTRMRRMRRRERERRRSRSSGRAVIGLW